MRNDCPLVIIRWQDSAQPLPSWQYLSALPRTRPIECATVGWLLRDDDDIKVICQSVGNLDNPNSAQASGIMTIPARCVLSIEKLTEEELLISSAGSVGSACSADVVGPADDAVDPKIGSTLTLREFEPHPA
jgi:hypothetical protein